MSDNAKRELIDLSVGTSRITAEVTPISGELDALLTIRSLVVPGRAPVASLVVRIGDAESAFDLETIDQLVRLCRSETRKL